MMRRPTFDAIAYCPDLEERLTLPQATVLVDRIAPRIPSLSRLVVAEVHARNFILYPGETGVVLFPPDALARQSDRQEFPEQAMVGRITYRARSSAPLNIIVYYRYVDEALVVKWGDLSPAPMWTVVPDDTGHP